ncbi:CobD/CbiB family protein [Massilia sp. B-10]|nr:CobD/CbiB family protein [Massilia sp. B-10]
MAVLHIITNKFDSSPALRYRSRATPVSQQHKRTVDDISLHSFALLIEQLKPLRADNLIYAEIKALAMRMEAWFNAGDASNGRMGWILLMAGLMIPTAVIYWVLSTYVGLFAAFAWNVLIVYLTLGFRHYSHYFTSIQIALSVGDEHAARSLLTEWTRIDTVGMEASEIARIAVEKSLVTTHRNVFGVFFWFLMPLGVSRSMVMYRVSEYLARAWNEPEHMKNEAFGQFAARAFYWIDWLPVRLTAIAFAVVGNFEDAIYAWRNFAHRWTDEARGIILAVAWRRHGRAPRHAQRKCLESAAAGCGHGRLHRQRSRSHAGRRTERVPCKARSDWSGVHCYYG